VNGKRDQSAAPPAPRLPELVHAGTLEIRADGYLHFDDWGWADPAARVEGRISFSPADGSQAIDGFLATCAGRSIAELHEMSHERGCECPVTKFTPRLVLGGEVVRTWGHDEPLPYSPSMWQGAR
jgi:hypothetical protein